MDDILEQLELDDGVIAHDQEKIADFSYKPATNKSGSMNKTEFTFGARHSANTRNTHFEASAKEDPVINVHLTTFAPQTDLFEVRLF